MRVNGVLLHGNSKRSHIISQGKGIARQWGGAASACKGCSLIVGDFL